MKKIPVGATIAHAYGFAFGSFLKILGVMWLAMAVMWLPGLVFRSQMAALATHDAAAIRQLLPYLIPFYVIVFILMCMQMIGIARLALGLQRGPAWVYFSLGKPVWRLIGSLLLLMLAMIVGWLIALLGGLLVGFLLGLLSKAVNYGPFTATMVFATGAFLFALWCGYFYCLIRLTFLLLPVVAAEDDGFALGDAWSLGKGNFWRMFAVLLSVLLPFLALELIAVFGVLFRGLHFPSAPVTAQSTAAFQVAMNARVMEMMSGIYHYWYIVYPVLVVVMVVLYGAAVGAQCFAYRALRDASGPVAGD